MSQMAHDASIRGTTGVWLCARGTVQGFRCRSEPVYAIESPQQGLQAWKHMSELKLICGVISSLLKQASEHPKQKNGLLTIPFTRYMTDTLQLPVIWLYSNMALS